jgi:phage shock protein PspC (stress-responsive transcriptional regulator)
MTTKLTRSYSDKMLSGVCGGIARYFNIDATIIRILFVLATIFGLGSPIIIYIILALLIPQS